MLPVVPMKPVHDKRSRLQVVAPYIQNGTVLFPWKRLRGTVRPNVQPRRGINTMTSATASLNLLQGLANQVGAAEDSMD